MTSQSPLPPEHVGPENVRWADERVKLGWDHFDLYKAVYGALYALPGYFKPDLNIANVLATDLHTFNTALGATIENQIVEALNDSRQVWDPEKKYHLFRFVRQAQRFPDVILRSSTPGKDAQVLVGIELKGWYALAKEREPSFRYTVTPAVCAPWDLLAVYPWTLSEVISGRPQLFEPYVVSARYAAEYRNWMWQHGMKSGKNRTVTLSTIDRFYPTKTDAISDQSVRDKGGNFGRIARTGIMDEYLAGIRVEKVSGIPLDAWQRFLSLFREDRWNESVARKVDRLTGKSKQRRPPLSEEDIESIREHLSEVISVLETRQSKKQ